MLWYQHDRLFRENAEPSLVIGEAKSFAQEAIPQKDINRLKLVAQNFPGAFIAIVVLKNGFSKKEKEQLIRLGRWGRRRRHNGGPIHPLIVLTGTELFSRWDVRQAWKEKSAKAKTLIEPG